MQAAGARGQLHRPRHLTCAPELTSHLPYNPISGLGARLQAQVDVPSAIHRHFPCARLAALMQLGVCGSGPGAFGSGFDLIRARIRVSTPVSGPWGAPFELPYAHGAYCAKCYIKQGLPMRFSPKPRGVSFHNHLVARCDIENWRRRTDLDNVREMGVWGRV